jgi:exodeoxyribonuclease VII large subunit
MEPDKIFQVSELNEFINLYLEQVGEVAVEGEISELRVRQNLYLFITIKDKKSSVDVFGIVHKLPIWNVLEEGMLIHVYGTPRLYQKTSRFSIFANQIVPAGEGALRLAFEKLRSKLEKEGLFDLERKRPLPIFPEKIGLITSKGSQAYSDFVKVLKERMGGIKIYFYPVNVQGRDSVSSILQAFKYFNKKRSNLDLLVLTRGGGSLEDLQSFNDEQIARAIFSSKIPVVCGIGHEDDISLADLVADKRASTPSNAAQLISRDREEVKREVNYCISYIENRLINTINEKKNQIYQKVDIIKSIFDQNITNLQKLINRFTFQFRFFKNELENASSKALDTKNRLIYSTDIWFEQIRLRLLSLLRLLKSLDYTQVLKRGFSITMDNKGSIIKSIKKAIKDEDMTTKLYDGKIYSRILRTKLK